MTIAEFNQDRISEIKLEHRVIACFKTQFESQNIDHSVVESFGEEWKKFHEFDDAELIRIGDSYFDIINESIINKNTYGLDVGCGTGRWTKYLLNRIGFMEAIDPSEAILAADKLIGDKTNVRLSMASTDNIPFDDETFDFVMSVGVLHHIPDTQKAMSDCVKKLKIGGYFYTYLYYNLENRGFVFKTLFSFVNIIRKGISALPSTPKKIACDLMAIFVYMPLVLLGRFFRWLGFRSLAKKIPLSAYQDKTFFIIRNDALDRFGTSLEQRFSKAEITEMMSNCGLAEIIIPDNIPYWHAIGKRVK